ncbi:trans-enoyl reductase ccsC [Colletotrichum liriopes]|uniref:Trans-enoyl reductase ccsC n=1 Tax=Colletotrichum liriopes TaxID=708192 RepID=A0AA37H3F6_9PEZI|nr:trans-enoyl reductase ccsC [Colletotrichum liriopes]
MSTLPALPSCQKAVVQADTNPVTFELSENRPIPAPLTNELLIKVAAVALNHCDWKMPGRVPCPGAVNGADYSGTIVRMGESATLTSGLRIGDRVAGAQVASSRGRPWAGAFAEYIRHEHDMVWKVPDSWSWEQAAAIGCATTSTIGMALWITLGLTGTPEEPTREAKFILVYGGATASGTFAIQVLKLQYVLDIITEARTIRHCYAAIGRGGGKYCGFELLPDDLLATLRRSVKADWTMGLELTGKEVDLPGGYYRAPNPELHDWFVLWKDRYVALYESGKIKPHPITSRQGGLHKVIDGIDTMRRREVSGEKIVYPLYDAASS